MNADRFGLHAVIDGDRDITELLDRCDALAQALGFDLAGRTASSSREGVSAYQCAGAEPLRVKVGFGGKSNRMHLLVYEDFETVGRYKPELIETLFAGICDIATPALARAFRGGSIDVVLDSEVDGLPQHLEWWQYFGPAICERIGRVRLLLGPFYRVEPRDTGACIVCTGRPPYGDRHGAASDEENRLWQLRRDAERFIADRR